ncbi:MAG: hypothetical protein PW790_05355 [Parvibaculaceae bacterium]|nr:hypothetical protein [Parvibaculaceae bacterium]
MLRRTFVRSAVVAAFAALAFMSPAMAADAPQLLGKFGGWAAYQFGTGANKICYVMGAPQKSAPEMTRGEVYFMITHRPQKQIRGEISMRAGYAFSKTSRPFAEIGKAKFSMFTGVAKGGENASWAWLESVSDEPKLVKAMRGGSTMTIKGTPNKGKLTTDTYSLTGISAALNKIDAACK